MKRKKGERVYAKHIYFGDEVAQMEQRAIEEYVEAKISRYSYLRLPHLELRARAKLRISPSYPHLLESLPSLW